ncbi:hypothetical protein QS257_20065 [Terrilactibacillus sp. S3-3]|nr:hypothetical protein QS257_20065 [Terrilactibacillus sp. S3-3]
MINVQSGIPYASSAQNGATLILNGVTSAANGATSNLVERSERR